VWPRTSACHRHRCPRGYVVQGRLRRRRANEGAGAKDTLACSPREIFSVTTAAADRRLLGAGRQRRRLRAAELQRRSFAHWVQDGHAHWAVPQSLPARVLISWTASLAIVPDVRPCATTAGLQVLPRRVVQPLPESRPSGTVKTTVAAAMPAMCVSPRTGGHMPLGFLERRRCFARLGRRMADQRRLRASSQMDLVSAAFHSRFE